MTMWRLKYVKHGGHVHCRLFAGPQKGALGLCGNLTFRVGEFAEFTRIHRVLGVEFVRESDENGPLGDSDVPFDTYERYAGLSP